jgi:hypothetical protein
MAMDNKAPFAYLRQKLPPSTSPKRGWGWLMANFISTTMFGVDDERNIPKLTESVSYNPLFFYISYGNA